MADELDFTFSCDSQPVEGAAEKKDIEIEMVDDLGFQPIKTKPNIIKVIGVGGGGSNAVTHMFNEGIKDVDFVLCNTDYQALETSPVSTKIHLGKRELGAGNVPAVGREAAEQSTEELRQLLSKNTKMVFVTAGMGGGTGTGAAPVVAEIAQELGILTIGIVTLPFKVEGRRRTQQALEGITKLRQHVDALLVISNDKLRQEYGNMKLTEAFKKADDVLKTAAKGIAEIITVTGYVNVDFEDVNNVMRKSGKAIMGSGRAEGEDRAQKAIEEAMNSPLLNDSNIQGAEKILLYITSGDDEVSLDEVMQITEYVQDNCGNTAEVIWGNGTDASLGKSVAVTLIATGFSKDTDVIAGTVEAEPAIEHKLDERPAENRFFEEPKLTEPAPELVTEPAPVAEPAAETEPDGNDTEPVVIHNIGEETTPETKENVNTTASVEPDEKEDIDEIVHTLYGNDSLSASRQTDAPRQTEQPKPNVHHFENPFPKRDSSNDDIFTNKANIQSPMGGYQPAQMTQPASVGVMEQQLQSKVEPNKERMLHDRLRQLSMLSSSPRGLEKLEEQPAYIRRGVNLSVESEEENYSHYSSKSNGLSSNSFLHDNVD